MKKTARLIYSMLALALAASGFAVLSPDGTGAAVPEPGTILLMGAGLAGLGYLGWRRNRKK
jgi:PEP-CTERM motif